MLLFRRVFFVLFPPGVSPRKLGCSVFSEADGRKGAEKIPIRQLHPGINPEGPLPQVVSADVWGTLTVVWGTLTVVWGPLQWYGGPLQWYGDPYSGMGDPYSGMGDPYSGIENGWVFPT